MEVLFLILNKTEYLDEVLSAYIDIGIKGATIIDSQGMGNALVTANNSNLPLFGSFKTLLEHHRPYNKVIFTVIEEEGLVEKAVKAVEGVVGDLSKPGVGLMFTLPLSNVYGRTKPQV